MKKNIKILFIFLLLITMPVISLAKTATTADNLQPAKTVVAERAKKENHLPPNYFLIELYQPNYILPYYATFSPDNAVYQNNTPNGESIKTSESKYQISLKVPIWKNIRNSNSSLYLAYTQLSYWQVYNHDRFFRETDYEPEIFLANQLNYHLIKNWQLTFMNVGLNHQSNGYGNQLERSWNRAYIEAIASNENWMVSFKPWYVLSTYPNNRDIAHFLGYGRLLVGYKFSQQVISFQAHSFITQAGRHKTIELTYSFPITPYIKGYIQAFSGYGQSLIEYNHHTNSLGIGIALNDWI